MATNNVHYAGQERHRLQDVLVCIRNLAALDEATHLRRMNSEYYLKSAPEMAALFDDSPQAITNTCEIAARCSFELGYGLQDLPHFPTRHGMSSSAYLRRLCHEAVPIRYGSQPPEKVEQQLQHELRIIEGAGLSNYFLIVWDMVRYARENGIRCQGRGSAANSLVAYLLDITPVDPLRFNLLFDRFLSSDRHTMPDIDIDFASDRREEVIQYIYRRYGSEHTAMVCNVNTFKSRSAIRDVARALGLQAELIPHLQTAWRRSQEEGGEADAGAEEEEGP